VQAGYDALAPRSAEWMAKIEGDPWERFVEELEGRLPHGGRLLDLIAEVVWMREPGMDVAFFWVLAEKPS
jgi:hypothetical protein